MGRMEQAEHIELLKKRSADREEKAIRIQEQYMLYLKEKAQAPLSDRSQAYLKERVEFALGELLLLLDDYCSTWINTQLWKTGCSSDEIKDTVLQDAHMAVSEAAGSAAGPGQAKDNFAYYAFGIYKNKTHDAIKKESRRRKIFPVVSMEEPIGESGQTVGDILPPAPFDDGEREERRRVYGGVFHVYCAAFLSSKAFPPKSIALCYARVLPHLLDAIPESKATSAKWAFTRMEGQSIDSLKGDSEHTLQRHVDSSLAWGAEFVRQLNGTLTVADRTSRLGDVIYTTVYDKGKIEDWADSMHKAAVKTAMALLAADSSLLDLAKEYAATNNVLSRFMRKGETCR